MQVKKQKDKRDRWIADLSLMDDLFFKVCMRGNIPATQRMVRVILGRSDIEVTKSLAQDELSNLKGSGATLDVYAEDSEGQMYNIEVQRDNRGAKPRRARRNSSLMDANVQDAGEYGEKLPESYVIFITEHDIFGRNEPLYTIDRYVKEAGFQEFDDGAHVIFVNGAYKGEASDIGKLIHDFNCKDPDEMYFEELAERPRKHKKGGDETMSLYYENMEKARAEGIEMGMERGMEKGMEKGRDSVFEAFRSIGVPEETIAAAKSRLAQA